MNEGAHSELARVLVTSLRDGYDLMDVVGRRLQMQVSAQESKMGDLIEVAHFFDCRHLFLRYYILKPEP